MGHLPVLLQEVISYLNPTKGKRFIDATIGLGGHSRAIVKQGGEVLGLDRDIASVGHLSNEFAITHGNFAEIEKIAKANGFDKVDGIIFDFGFSSEQVDDPKRGFSFQKDGPLDMRFDVSQAKTAKEVIAEYSEKNLIEVFQNFGEERRFGKRVARAIVAERQKNNILSTAGLFSLLKKSLPGKFRGSAADVARRIFQAIRIEVNDELKNIEKALPQAVRLLKSRGRLVTISFHSLEDRLVKQFFKNESQDCICPPEIPVCSCDKVATLKILTKKAVKASSDEVRVNSRAKSAKLRAAEKI